MIAVVAAVAIAAALAAYAIASKGTMGSQPPQFLALRISTSSAGLVVPVVFGTNRIAGNMLWAGDFSVSQQSQGGKGGGGGKKGGSSYTYSVSFAMAICEGEIPGLGRIWSDKTVYASLTDLINAVGGGGITLLDGSYPQLPWSYLSTAHPTEALPYPGIAYIGAANMPLGNSDHVPNLNFEVQGLNIVSGIKDANPADIISAIITNQKFGLSLPSSLIDVADYANWCLAQDFLLSPAFVEQKKATEQIASLLDQTFSTAIVHNGSVLKVIPFGDAPAYGNGTYWSPFNTPLYDLTDEDFIADAGADPVKMTRTSPADAFNDVKIEWSDRDNEYAVAPAEYQDQCSIDLYLLRQDSTKQCHAVTRGSVARNLVQLIGQRGLYVRNQYHFTLGIRHCILEPMDIVTLTDTGLGLNKAPVRILTIEEDEDWEMKITAEEWLSGVGSAAIYASQGSSSYSADHNVAPGSVNTPVIFQVPQSMQSGTKPEVWIAVSGASANWGGCNVWASVDGVSYQMIGQAFRSRQGLSTAALPVGIDPDTINTLPVDLTESLSELLSGTQQDADLLHTLCYCDGEFISYQDALLGVAYHYTLETYLRRGCYGSLVADHALGSVFARLDDRIFKYAFAPQYIGLTIHLKFQSFNIYGAALESMASVTDYTIAVGAVPTEYSHQCGANVAVPGAGLSIVYGPAFSSLAAGTPTVIVLNPQVGDSTVITASTVTGFTVQIMNGGVGVARNINWIAQGIV